jgi:transposase
MLNDADFTQFKHVYVFVGKTDLRKGIDGLATLVKQKFSLDPFQPGNLFLFCGSSSRKIKGLVWEEDGFLLIYKRLEAGTFQWPRSAEEARNITPEQYHLLMSGYSMDSSVHKVQPRNTL